MEYMMIPGFKILFGLIGLLVVAYLLRTRN
jgi:hypothetical protein